MKKNNGFTLIELLAVIVILSIILVVAIPQILGVIKDSTKNAFEIDAKMIIHAIEYKKLEDPNFNPQDVTEDSMTTILGLSNNNYSQVSVSIVDDKVNVVLVGQNKWNNLTAYGIYDDITVVNSEDYDVTLPTVAFGTNGNGTYAKSGSTTVTISDNVGVNTDSLKYQWTTSTTEPTEASFTTEFTNGAVITTPADITGGYYLWIFGKDINNNTMITGSNVFNIDNTNPAIVLSGINTTYTCNQFINVTANASDNIGINTSSLKYQWTTSTTVPAEASFTTTFTNGQTISMQVQEGSGTFYLWALAYDTAGNKIISSSAGYPTDCSLEPPI